MGYGWADGWDMAPPGGGSEIEVLRSEEAGSRRSTLASFDESSVVEIRSMADSGRETPWGWREDWRWESDPEGARGRAVSEFEHWTSPTGGSLADHEQADDQTDDKDTIYASTRDSVHTLLPRRNSDEQDDYPRERYEDGQTVKFVTWDQSSAQFSPIPCDDSEDHNEALYRMSTATRSTAARSSIPVILHARRDTQVRQRQGSHSLDFSLDAYQDIPAQSINATPRSSQSRATWHPVTPVAPASPEGSSDSPTLSTVSTPVTPAVKVARSSSTKLTRRHRKPMGEDLVNRDKPLPSPEKERKASKDSDATYKTAESPSLASPNHSPARTTSSISTSIFGTLKAVVSRSPSLHRT
ncbi:hypothetical protein P7C70_g3009, partial [Phenoliferia sp. Uapishka_3]